VYYTTWSDNFIQRNVSYTAKFMCRHLFLIFSKYAKVVKKSEFLHLH